MTFEGKIQKGEKKRIKVYQKEEKRGKIKT
jgi:hypothetical protein